MALAERTWKRVGERDRARLIESAVYSIYIKHDCVIKVTQK